MAVGLQAPISSKTSAWVPTQPSTKISQASEPMTAIMSYHYPLPPAPDVDVSPTGLVNNYHLPTIPPLQPQPPNKTGPARRGTSGPSKVGKVKRSASSPNVRGQAKSDQIDAAFLSLSDDKRRNKLGYHRTSVACGHCRRRKIRCIPATGDPQSRCANCIRLKKECHFHPVDQQTETGLSSRGDSQAQGAIGAASPSSSPTNGATPTSELPTLPYPHLSMPPINDIAGTQMKKPRTDSFSPENKAPLGPRGPEYSHPPASWMPHDPISMAKGSSDMSSSYWRLNSHEAPLTPAFSPFTQNMQLPPHPTWSHAAPEPSAREDLGWQVPQRSASYSHHEGLPHPSSFSAFHHPSADPNVRDDFGARPASQQHEAYPPSLTPTSASTSAADAPLSATSADAAPHASGPSSLPPPFPNPQGWQTYPYKTPALPSSSEGFQGWYGQNTPVPSLPHGTEGMAPPTYGHIDSYAGMYYHNAAQGGR